MPGTFQIGGLVSGLDTGKIIEQLMTLEQRPLRQLESRQQQIKDRKAALSDLNAKLSLLRTKTMSLMLSSTTLGRKATVGNSAVATASALPSTAIQQVTLNVTQLATKTSVSSAASIGQPIDSTATLANAGFATRPTTGSFSINGTTIAVDAAMDTLDDVINRINASTANVTASLVGNELQLQSTAGPITIGVHGNTSNFLSATKLAASTSAFDGVTTWTNTSTGGLGSAQPTALLQDARLATPLATPPVPASGTFTINGQSFSWDASVDSINSIVSKINNNATAKVTASYDQATDKFTLVAKDTGPAAIGLSDDSGNLLDALGVAGATQDYGKTAQYSINGGPTQSSTSNVVTDAVSGVTFTLKGNGTTTVDIAQDVEKAVNGVKEWVQAYNDAVDLIRQQMAVDPATNQGSIFTGNPMIQGIEMRLRRVTSTPDLSLSSTYTELPRIGISTGPIGSAPGTTDKIVLDEAKLTQALQQDPTAVTALLTSPTGPVASLNSYLLGITSYTGPLNSSQLAADRQITELSTRMRGLQQRINARQLALEQKFANLEAAMAKLQAQSAQLAGQLGSLGSLQGK